jgi:predicted adenine nucleotide alpha hydrolase (AANH) superfamily ATPase
VALKKGFDLFTTVLTVSPHKNARAINQIGSEISGRLRIEFLEADFKKKDGFKKSVELSRGYGLYRQDYCGCTYSRNKMRGVKGRKIRTSVDNADPRNIRTYHHWPGKEGS